MKIAILCILFTVTTNPVVIHTKSASPIYHQDQQVLMLQQQVWTNLQKVPNTQNDYISFVKFRLADGNIIDADCKLIFPAMSWTFASIVVDDYKEVLKRTKIGIFEVIYKLITDDKILATEIYFNGLWRPWGGSHVHPDGRGIDIKYINQKNSNTVTFNRAVSTNENSYGKAIRQQLTTNFPTVTQYLSPWFMCQTLPTCTVNTGQSSLEKIHKDHLHLTLKP